MQLESPEMLFTEVTVAASAQSAGAPAAVLPATIVFFTASVAEPPVVGSGL
jgi:hypothetical protein